MTPPHPSRAGVGDRIIAWCTRSVVESGALRRLAHTRVGRTIRTSAPVDHVIRRLDRMYGAQAVLRGSDPGSGPTRFIVLCQPRTGSNLLQTELNRRWRVIRCAGERYSKRFRNVGETTAEVTEAVFTPYGRHTIMGCRVFYDHLSPSEWRGILALEGMRVVHLRRRNLLRRFVSAEIAWNSQQWTQARSAQGPSVEEKSVTIDVESFLRSHQDTLDVNRRMGTLLDGAGVAVLDVWYEDLVADLDGQCRRVAEFLGAGAPRSGGAPELVRQNPEPLRLLLRNYDEVQRRLSTTALRTFLDADDARRPSVAPREAARSCWPTPEQELLLRAALAPPEEVGAAFEAWRTVVDPVDVDSGSRRLFALLYRNLRRAGATTDMDADLKHSYVDAAVRNQQLFRTLEGVLECLDDAGVPTLVLKGAALSVLAYRDRGARPMADLDVMVARPRVDEAIVALRAGGWQVARRRPQHPVGELTRVRHSVVVQRDSDELDLHWDAFAECTGTDLGVAFWEAAVELEIGARRTRALAPADQLLHAIVHGLRFNPIPPLRWIADAHAVIESSGAALDWDRLLRLAEQHRLVAPVSAGLGYLDRGFSGLVPPAVAGATRSLPVTRREQRAFTQVTHAHWVLGSGREIWRHHRRREPDEPVLRATVGFLDDLRVLYDLDDARQLPERILRGMRERRRSERTVR